jgi:glycosyltransferase involved in cell wall biosynthesis
MRLLHVYSGNLYGGVETILVSLARHRALCPWLAHDFALCFDGRLRRELVAEGATVHALGEVRASRPHTIVRAREALARLLSTTDAATAFDRIICHAPWSQALFGGIARRAGIPLMFWMHDAAGSRHWTEWWARRTPPDLVICNSHYTAGTLPRLYPDAPATVVYPPVDISEAPVSAADRNAVRAELRTAGDAVVIVQVSRMQAWKGHRAVLKALGEVRDQPGWVWWSVGGAQRAEEASYAAALVASAETLGIADRIRWVGERRDVARLLGAADVHCQMNETPEPFGMAYVEALAAGLPVVAARAGGVTEIVDDSCGVLVEPGDTSALTTAIAQLVRDPSYRARLAAHAPARARQLCDPAAQMRRLGEAVLAAGPPVDATSKGTVIRDVRPRA